MHKTSTTAVSRLSTRHGGSQTPGNRKFYTRPHPGHGTELGTKAGNGGKPGRCCRSAPKTMASPPAGSSGKCLNKHARQSPLPRTPESPPHLAKEFTPSGTLKSGPSRCMDPHLEPAAWHGHGFSAAANPGEVGRTQASKGSHSSPSIHGSWLRAGEGRCHSRAAKPANFRALQWFLADKLFCIKRVQTNHFVSDTYSGSLVVSLL